MTDPHAAPSNGSSRRELVHASLAALGLAALSGRRAGAAATPDDAGDALDAAYERILASFPHANVHASNHAPMVCEALAVLGRPDSLGPWLDAHLDRAARDERPRRALDPERWRDALGRPDRNADWHALFVQELEREGPAPVLSRWVPRLAPGLAGAATHGVIRTAHAARAAAARASEVRRRELAAGLAYWAATYQELPWDGRLAPEPSVADALATLETRLPERPPPRGNIVAGLAALDDTPSFQGVAGKVDVRDPLRTLSEITETFAHVYLCHPGRRVHFTHAVTAPSALRLLVPYLDGEALAAGVRHAWQAAAGLYVVYGDRRAVAPEPAPPRPRRELVARALASGGSHAIKLLEACLREHAARPSPVLLAAARDAAEDQGS